MSIQNGLNAAVYTVLSGTSLGTLTSGGTAAPSVYFEQAPDNSSLPYVVWLYPSELDENIIKHRMKNIVMRVYAVAAAPAQAGTLDSTIDALLHEQEVSIGTAYGYTNIWLRRENGYQLISTSEAGVRYYTSGADYRVELTKG